LQLGKVLGGGEERFCLVAEGQALIRLQCRTKLAINAPHETHDRKFKVSRFDAPRGDTKMRRGRRPASEHAGTTAYTFHFQITNKGGRQACSVKVEAQSISDATTLLRENWPMIESMARDRLVSTSSDDRTIKLAVP
jgi:hypothetical protein